MRIPMPNRTVRRAIAGLCALGAAGALMVSSAAANSPTSYLYYSHASLGTSVLVSPNGVISQFNSPDNASFSTNNIAARDGYAVCDWTHMYWETGTLGASGFGPATTNSSNGVQKVVRSTLDKRYKLTQEFSFQPALRHLTVKMTVTNTSSQTVGVGLRRFSDFDVDSRGTSGWAGFKNHFARTRTAVIAWDDFDQANEGHGMVLTGESNPPGHKPTPEVTNNFIPPVCAPVSANTPDASYSDHAAGLFYDAGTLKSGQSFTVTLGYLRI